MPDKALIENASVDPKDYPVGDISAAIVEKSDKEFAAYLKGIKAETATGETEEIAQAKVAGEVPMAQEEKPNYDNGDPNKETGGVGERANAAGRTLINADPVMGIPDEFYAYKAGAVYDIEKTKGKATPGYFRRTPFKVDQDVIFVSTDEKQNKQQGRIIDIDLRKAKPYQVVFDSPLMKFKNNQWFGDDELKKSAELDDSFGAAYDTEKTKGTPSAYFRRTPMKVDQDVVYYDPKNELHHRQRGRIVEIDARKTKPYKVVFDSPTMKFKNEQWFGDDEIQKASVLAAVAELEALAVEVVEAEPSDVEITKSRPSAYFRRTPIKEDQEVVYYDPKNERQHHQRGRVEKVDARKDKPYQVVFDSPVMKHKNHQWFGDDEIKKASMEEPVGDEYLVEVANDVLAFLDKGISVVTADMLTDQGKEKLAKVVTAREVLKKEVVGSTVKVDTIKAAIRSTRDILRVEFDARYATLESKYTTLSSSVKAQARYAKVRDAVSLGVKKRVIKAEDANAEIERLVNVNTSEEEVKGVIDTIEKAPSVVVGSVDLPLNVPSQQPGGGTGLFD